jgi:DNA polymerase III alpha subunit (gram-positive type)
LGPETILIADVETQGLDPGKDEVIEVAVVHFDVRHASIIASYSSLLPADSNAAEEINGISPELLRSLSPRETLIGALRDWRWEPVLHLARQADAFVAHRASFDRAFFPLDIARLLPWIDTKFACEWPRGRWADHLTGLALSHGVTVMSAHRALDDCLLLARVMQRVQETSDFRLQTSARGESDGLRSEVCGLRSILERGLSRGVGDCPKCEEPGCGSYVRGYVGVPGLIPRCAKHGGSKTWFGATEKVTST